METPFEPHTTMPGQVPNQRLPSSLTTTSKDHRPPSINLNNREDRAQIPFQITLCRFDSGKLEKLSFNESPRELTYIAVSHVWGEADWHDIDGVGPVLASAEKLKFITERLESIVGIDLFWMDILCIDQRSKDARIAVTRHIPTIFRFSQRTIVVRDSSGFENCCIQALEDVIYDRKDRVQANEAIYNHHIATHLGGRWFREGVLSRLWLLEEVILSDVIQFVRCDSVSQANVAGEKNAGFEEDGVMLFAGLQSLSNQWGKDIAKEKFDEQRRAFMHAFLNSKTIVRGPTVASSSDAMLYTDIARHIGSTNKPRDFILAVVPQYDFYVLPDDAKSMKFGQLFVDCYYQLERVHTSNPPLIPLLVDCDIRYGTFIPMQNIPEPVIFGDFAKLLLGAKPRLTGDPNGKPLGQLYGHPVHIRHEIPPFRENVLETVKLLLHSESASLIEWIYANSGEMHETRRQLLLLGRINFNELTHYQLSMYFALRILDHIHEAALRVIDITPEVIESVIVELMTFDWFKMSLPNFDPDFVLRVATMISCGLGISAINWSVANLSLVFVEKSILALVPKALVGESSGYEFFLVECDELPGFNAEKPYRLIARNPTVDPHICKMCLFPPNASFEED